MKAPSPVLSSPNPASSRPSQAVTPRSKVGPGATVGDTGYGAPLFSAIWRRLGRWPRKEAEDLGQLGAPERLSRRLPPLGGSATRVARPGHLPGALGAPGRGSRGLPPREDSFRGLPLH